MKVTIELTPAEAKRMNNITRWFGLSPQEFALEEILKGFRAAEDMMRDQIQEQAVSSLNQSEGGG